MEGCGRDQLRPGGYRDDTSPLTRVNVAQGACGDTPFSRGYVCGGIYIYIYIYIYAAHTNNKYIGGAVEVGTHSHPSAQWRPMAIVVQPLSLGWSFLGGFWRHSCTFVGVAPDFLVHSDRSGRASADTRAILCRVIFQAFSLPSMANEP